jgi:hypothetical protein
MSNASVRCYLPPIKFFPALVLGRNAPPLSLPCHTCRPLSSLFVEHFKHHWPPSLLTSLEHCHRSLQFWIVLLPTWIINLQMTREFEFCVKTKGVGDLIWNASNINRFGIMFLVHPQPSIWKWNKPSRYPKPNFFFF